MCAYIDSIGRIIHFFATRHIHADFLSALISKVNEKLITDKYGVVPTNVLEMRLISYFESFAVFN